jgi:superfamily II DNA or RNA helicase
LSDEHKVITGTKHKKWLVGEATQYAYLTQMIQKGQQLMAGTGSRNWFEDAANWFWKGLGNPEQKNAARIYLNAIKNRKDFLWNLTSSAEIAKEMKKSILVDSNNKTLIFSERTSQIDKVTAFAVHSKNTEDVNTELIKQFNSGKIKELGSCMSLTLGLNLKEANWAIMESYSGSPVQAQQRVGRTDRLDIDDIAHVVWIVPLGTQTVEWYGSATKNIKDKGIETIRVKNMEQFSSLINLKKI